MRGGSFVYAGMVSLAVLLTNSPTKAELDSKEGATTMRPDPGLQRGNRTGEDYKNRIGEDPRARDAKKIFTEGVAPICGQIPSGSYGDVEHPFFVGTEAQHQEAIREGLISGDEPFVVVPEPYKLKCRTFFPAAPK
jgi:hypothetical protein